MSKIEGGEPFDFNTGTTTPVVEEKKPTNEIDELLSGYKEVSKVDTSQVQTSAAPVTNGNTVVQQPVNSGQQYYKSGKKAGQPKPNKTGVTFNRTTEVTSLSGEVLSGALFITLVDLILPILIVAMDKRFFKGGKIKVSDLALSEKQKKELAPIADKVVKQLDFQANPNMLLILSMLGIYGANYAALKMIQKNENNTQSNSEKQNGQNNSGRFDQGVSYNPNNEIPIRPTQHPYFNTVVK